MPDAPPLSLGPLLLTLAPTRELACQIEVEAQKFGRPAGIQSACAYGGAPKGPQLGALRRGAHVLIATPGRLNDFLEMGAVRLRSIMYLVLDEAATPPLPLTTHTPRERERERGRKSEW